MISVIYYDPEPEGGYVSPFQVAYFFDEHSMTVLLSDHPLVARHLDEGGTVLPYEPPATPPDPVGVENGGALRARKKAEAKARVEALIAQGKTAEALSAMMEIMEA